MREYDHEPEPDPLALAERMDAVDIVLFEGFRNAPIPMIEVHRPALGRPMLWRSCPSVIAVAADGTVDCPLPILDLADQQGIADFLLAHLRRT